VPTAAPKYAFHQASYHFRVQHNSHNLPQNFQVQLAPFIDAVQKSGKGSFKWINGAHKAVPPTGFDDYFGTPPLFRFMEFDGVEGLGDMLEKVRDFPEGMSAEDTIRQLIGDDQVWTGKAVRSALDRLFEIIDSDPEIDVSLSLCQSQLQSRQFD
jgi:hypothetical protein